MDDKKVFDILDKFEFFQGQRAGRELWNDKPKEVQDQDIADFVKGINYIRDYLKNSVVLTVEELKNIKKNEYRRGKTQQCWDIQKQAEKKTVEKFTDFIKSKLFDLGNIVNERDIDDMLKEFNNENQ